MPDYTQLLDAMKRVGVNATEAGNPVNVCFGNVIQISPLKLLVEQKVNLGLAQLVLTETVSEKLNLNDVVVLLRVQGGQKYIIIDKVV